MNCLNCKVETENGEIYLRGTKIEFYCMKCTKKVMPDVQEATKSND